jgi:hypothetical protein
MQRGLLNVGPIQLLPGAIEERDLTDSRSTVDQVVRSSDLRIRVARMNVEAQTAFGLASGLTGAFDSPHEGCRTYSSPSQVVQLRSRYAGQQCPETNPLCDNGLNSA